MTPTPRYGHVMTPGNLSNEIFVFGGLNEKQEFCDKELFMLYETSKQSDKNWKIVDD
jgi:hypothetical protein